MMDDWLRQRVLAVSKQLAVEEKDRLAALGTFGEIEDLTAEIGDEGLYGRWARAIWQGRVGNVLAELTSHQERLGAPPPDASANDPGQRIGRTATCDTNHQSRMNCPEYRRLGLPITSSLLKSAIKQLSRRVKGTEKFWNQPTTDAILHLRADSLSDSDPPARILEPLATKIAYTNRFRVSV